LQYLATRSGAQMPPAGRMRELAFALYRRAGAQATGFSLARMRRNTTVVNSDWTGAEVRRLHGIDTITIHPPAVGPFPSVPWSERVDGFVAVGRIVPEKRLELIIDIVERVRQAAGVQGAPRDISGGGAAEDLFPIPLHIVASAGDPGYEARVLARARKAGPWVRVHRQLSRRELVSLLTRHRYGIHGMAEEHFGMAVAEMVAAGMIPFIPRGGGQVEIVRDERLLWTSIDDAVAKIGALRSSAAERESVRLSLGARAPELGPERFMREIRAVVKGAIARDARPAGRST
ncbi:MAG TPA: glycosyltransferase, partial [Polyangia bacterium]